MKYQLLIVVLVGLAMGNAGGWVSAADISGTWEFSTTLEIYPENPLTQTFIFKQRGEKLTGTQPDAAAAGEGKVTGTVKGDKVVFSVEVKNSRGELVKSTYTGTLESPNKMTGSLECAKGPGKWTATKK